LKEKKNEKEEEEKLSLKVNPITL